VYHSGLKMLRVTMLVEDFHASLQNEKYIMWPPEERLDVCFSWLPWQLPTPSISSVRTVTPPQSVDLLFGSQSGHRLQILLRHRHLTWSSI